MLSLNESVYHLFTMCLKMFYIRLVKDIFNDFLINKSYLHLSIKI